MSVTSSHLMQCPECKADSDIYIVASITIKLLPHGEIEQHPIEWHDRNVTRCGKCKYAAECQDFAVDDSDCE